MWKVFSAIPSGFTRAISISPPSRQTRLKITLRQFLKGMVTRGLRYSCSIGLQVQKQANARQKENIWSHTHLLGWLTSVTGCDRSTRRETGWCSMSHPTTWFMTLTTSCDISCSLQFWKHRSCGLSSSSSSSSSSTSSSSMSSSSIINDHHHHHHHAFPACFTQ